MFFFKENFSGHEFEEKIKLNIKVISLFDDLDFFKNYEKKYKQNFRKIKIINGFWI